MAGSGAKKEQQPRKRRKMRSHLQNAQMHFLQNAFAKHMCIGICIREVPQNAAKRKCRQVAIGRLKTCGKIR